MGTAALVCLLLVVLYFTTCQVVRNESVPEVAFPWHNEMGIPGALASGRLNIQNGCLLVGETLLPIWPERTRLVRDAGRVAIANDDGSIIAHVGDEVWLGGGATTVQLWDADLVPQQCEKGFIYWLTGSVGLESPEGLSVEEPPSEPEPATAEDRA